jgi:hypothetical protein
VIPVISEMNQWWMQCLISIWSLWIGKSTKCVTSRRRLWRLHGLCADIGFDRLMAYPTAKRCLVCQQQHDRAYAEEAHPSLGSPEKARSCLFTTPILR